MQVKSFTAGVVNGLQFALNRLDEQVNNLKAVEIESLTDTYLPEDKQTFEYSNPGPRIVRVVVYKALHQ